MAETIIIDGVYVIKKRLGKGGMATVYLSEVDLNRFDYTTLYAYTQVQGETHLERRLKAEELSEKLRGETLDLATIRSILKAQDIPIPREQVAVKVATTDSELARFEGEWKNLMCLSHENVIQVYGGGMYKKRPYYSMELMENMVPIERIKDEFTIRQKLDVLMQAGRGLSYLHSNGIIHRDVKPDNAVVCEVEPGKFVTKVTDLGIAKNVEAVGMTMSQTVMGTPHYMSPEQLESSTNVDRRADIYSLGASLYELVTGVKPYHDKTTVFEIIAAVSRGEMPAPAKEHLPELPDVVAAIITCAMEPDLSKRYETMDDVVADLKTYIEQESADVTESISFQKADIAKSTATAGTGAYNFEKMKRKRVTEAAAKMKKAGPSRAPRRGEGRARPAKQRAAPATAPADAAAKKKLIGAAVAAGALLLCLGLYFGLRPGPSETPEPSKLPVTPEIVLDGKPVEICDGMVLFYDFDSINKTTVTDVSGTGNDGVVYGAEQVDGLKGKAIEFTAANQYVANAVVPKNLPSGNTPRTMIVWVKTENWSGRNAISGYGHNATNRNFQISTINGRLNMLGWGKYNDWSTGISVEDFNGFNWYCFAVSYDGKTTKVYVDGAEKDSTDRYTWNTDPRTIMIGKEIDGSGWGFIGAIDEFMIFNRALSKKEIAHIYRKAVGLGPAPTEQELHAALKAKNPTYRGNARFGKKGANIVIATLVNANVTDLSPLRGLPLEEVDCSYNKELSDLSPLAGMSLTILKCGRTSVKDISPVRGMPLIYLFMDNAKVEDLSPLEGASLQIITFTPGNVTKGISTLRNMKTLKEIGDDYGHRLPPSEFWKKYDAGKSGKPAAPDPQPSFDFGSADLALFYNFNNCAGNKVPDLSGSEHNGQIHGAELRQIDDFGTAISFDGKNDYVDCGAPGPAKGSITLSAWIRTAQNLSRQRWIMSRSRWQAGAWQLITHRGKAGVEFGPGGQLLGRTNIADDRWHHIVGLYNSETNERRLYVDGELEVFSADKPAFRENQNRVFIGVRDGGSDFFKGLVDNVMVFHRVLSDGEVKAFHSYKNPARPPSSSETQTNTGTKSGLTKIGASNDMNTFRTGERVKAVIDGKNYSGVIDEKGEHHYLLEMDNEQPAYWMWVEPGNLRPM